jgi:hypothetical protein
LPQAYGDQLWEAVRILFLSGIVMLAHKTAKDAGEKNGRLAALRNGVLWCVAIAFFAAASLGSPSCDEQGDPIRGGCDQYADDGYTPSADQRGSTFLFWFVVLIVPVAFGVTGSRKFSANPWRRPDSISGSTKSD